MRFPAVSPAALGAALAMSVPTDAFIPSLTSSQVTRYHCRYLSTSVTGALHMSDDDDLDDLFGEEDDDALSALIGKRAKMYESKPKESKPKPPSTAEEIDAKLDEIEQKVADFDYMDDLPEFSTKRPLRTPKRKEEEEKDDPNAADTDEVRFIDYKAEYDDENELHIPNRMGFGTAAWGEIKAGFKEGKKLKKKEIKAGRYLAGDLQISYNSLLENGITFVDTSESYGRSLAKKNLSAEHILGQCYEENSDVDPLIASTFANPWMHLLDGGGLRYGRRGLVKALEDSCDRVGTGVELYQVPAALYLGFPNALPDGLSQCLDKGLCNFVGVTNMGKMRMKSMARKMDKRGASLTSNQFAFSLTNRKAWKSGLIKACKDLGVIPIAHTPLDGGFATCAYTMTNPSGGRPGGRFPYNQKKLEKWQPLTSQMEAVQSRVKTRLEKEAREQQQMLKDYRGQPPQINTDVTTTQIALNYVVAKGCVPVPGIKTVAQAEEVLGCLGWELTDEEVRMLDSAADASEKGLSI